MLRFQTQAYHTQVPHTHKTYTSTITALSSDSLTDTATLNIR